MFLQKERMEMSMRITDLLDAKSISLNLSPKSKSEALDMAVDLMVKSGKINAAANAPARTPQTAAGLFSAIKASITKTGSDHINTPIIISFKIFFASRIFLFFYLFLSLFQLASIFIIIFINTLYCKTFVSHIYI